MTRNPVRSTCFEIFERPETFGERAKTTTIKSSVTRIRGLQRRPGLVPGAFLKRLVSFDLGDPVPLLE